MLKNTKTKTKTKTELHISGNIHKGITQSFKAQAGSDLGSIQSTPRLSQIPLWCSKLAPKEINGAWNALSIFTISTDMELQN
jgi:hypothetical protein